MQVMPNSERTLRSENIQVRREKQRIRGQALHEAVQRVIAFFRIEIISSLRIDKFQPKVVYTDGYVRKDERAVVGCNGRKTTIQTPVRHRGLSGNGHDGITSHSEREKVGFSGNLLDGSPGPEAGPARTRPRSTIVQTLSHRQSGAGGAGGQSATADGGSRKPLPAKGTRCKDQVNTSFTDLIITTRF